MTEYNFQGDSWITYCTYNSDTKELSIHTKSKVYTLVGVPLEVYEAFSFAGSKGRFFNEHLKGKYQDAMFKP